MAEQSLANSTDIPSASHIMKDSTSMLTNNVNSLIRRSLSNKLNVSAATPASSMASIFSSSTPSLGMYCIETGSIEQSSTNETGAITTTPVDDDRVFNDDNKRQELSLDVEKLAIVNDSDDDFSDDEGEPIIAEHLYSLSSITPLNYIIMPCPICFEPSALQSSPCCTFYCCNSCWRSHISSAINDGRIKISCISYECNKYLPRESVVNFIRDDTLLNERYLRLYTNANQNPRAKTCPRCSHLYSLDVPTPLSIKSRNKKTPKQVQCSECSLVWCFRCSAPWHENMTCKQFIKGDKLLLKWINQKNEEQWNARKCPRCSSLIQRAGGCPHMTCQSCSCQFCYLCGRRYVKIPFFGQHNNKFSMFGCPYNLHPEKPWLRRTIRGAIATSVVVASPILVVGAVTAAVTILPSIGIYKLIKRARIRRHTLYNIGILDGQDTLFHEPQEEPNELFRFQTHDGDLDTTEMMRMIEQRLERLRRTESENEVNDENFPLAIFADMDVENLFADNFHKSPSDFRTCPTTPVIDLRKGHSQSSNNLTTTNPSTRIRRHFIILEE